MESPMVGTIMTVFSRRGIDGETKDRTFERPATAKQAGTVRDAATPCRPLVHTARESAAEHFREYMSTCSEHNDSIHCRTTLSRNQTLCETIPATTPTTTGRQVREVE